MAGLTPNTEKKTVDSTLIYQKVAIKFQNAEIIADIADTQTKRELGLSGRRELVEGGGMLFVFDETANHGFWMKDMKFPIDILWIDENKQIIDSISNWATSTYPKISYPKQKAKYVLELPAGFIDAHKIKLGEFLEF